MRDSDAGRILWGRKEALLMFWNVCDEVLLEPTEAHPLHAMRKELSPPTRATHDALLLSGPPPSEPLKYLTCATSGIFWVGILCTLDSTLAVGHPLRSSISSNGSTVGPAHCWIRVPRRWRKVTHVLFFRRRWVNPALVHFKERFLDRFGQP
jgi:hypothetical protein